MMNYFHLLWIIPLAACAGFGLHALCTDERRNRDADR